MNPYAKIMIKKKNLILSDQSRLSGGGTIEQLFLVILLYLILSVD